MEIYKLDSSFNRSDVIDQFESFIWTERYSDIGEMKIKVIDNAYNRSLFRDGTMITHSLSNIIMVVETRFRKDESSGVSMLEVTGKSYEAILKNRVVYPESADKKTWDRKGTLGWLATRLVGDHMMSGATEINDILPELYFADTTGLTTQVDSAVAMGTLYDGVKKLCDSGKLGFRIQLMPTSPRLRFNVHAGRDLKHVVFSSTLDSLTQESHLHDVTNYRNIAVVFGKDGKKRVTVAAPGVDVNRKGWNRKVLSVDAEDIDPTKSTAIVYENQLKQRGLEALAQANVVDIFDAELTGIDPYDYRYSYSLGDTITMMDAENQKHTAVISEYIWSWDVNGLKSYPTFVSTDEWNAS